MPLKGHRVLPLESSPQVSSLTILFIFHFRTTFLEICFPRKFQNWHRYDFNNYVNLKKGTDDVHRGHFSTFNSNTCRKNFHRIPYYSAHNTRHNIDLLHFYSILPFYFDRSRSWHTTSLDTAKFLEEETRQVWMSIRSPRFKIGN